MRASLSDSAVRKRRRKRARGDARNVVGGRRGGHRPQRGAGSARMAGIADCMAAGDQFGGGAAGVHVEVNVDCLSRGVGARDRRTNL